MNENTALAIRSVADLEAVGEKFEQSGMFGCTQKGQGMVLAMTCFAEGISPIRFNQTYHIIDGRVTMRADAMLAKFIERGGRFTIRERSANRAAALFELDGNALEAEYTMADARDSGICFGKDGKSLKHNWARFPKQMLWARLISDTVRTLAPGVNMGAYTPEEVQDFDAVPPSRQAEPDAVQPIRARKTKAAQAEPESEPAKQDPAAEPAATPDPVEPEVVKDEDFGVMPAGKHAGKPWSDFTADQLKSVLQSNHAAFAEGHKAAVRAELERRGGAA